MPTGYSRTLNLASLRGFMPSRTPANGRAVAGMWRERFEVLPDDHPFSLYVHVPFCPQICSFCQCSTGLAKHARQLDDYVAWLEGEMAFFAPAVGRGRVRLAYIGGGTPNMLSDIQLERLLGALGRAFRYEPGARRTFEILPSALREGTLARIRAHGFNRLSCGVQSVSATTLAQVHRAVEPLDALRRMVDEAYALGFDDINLDLIWSLGGESDEAFLESLLTTLALGPTTVTVHKLLPPTSRAFHFTPDEETARERAFRGLAERLRPALDRRAPGRVWVHRPNSAIVVDRTFYEGPLFSNLFYSDSERIHLDMLGLGRYACSRIMGRAWYEGLGQEGAYDAELARYSTFEMTPTVDAALDVITDLMADGSHDLGALEARYGARWMPPVHAALRELEAAGRVRRDGRRVHYLLDETVFVDPLAPLLALTGWNHSTPRSGATQGVLVRRGAFAVRVFVEPVKQGGRYYGAVGHLGLFYRTEGKEAPPPLVEGIMERATAEVTALVARQPDVDFAHAAAHLEAELNRTVT